MSIELITVLMFSSLFLLLFLGFPLTFSLGSVAIIFGFFLWGPSSTNLIVSKVFGLFNTTILVATPLFIFMANVLRRSGVADDLFDMMYLWLNAVKGGLAIGTVGICTIFAAMSGISGAGTVTMGIIALPAMLKRNYDKHLAIGCILAGGALGPLIPPSVIMVIYGLYSGVSVGKLFVGGIVPGLILSSLFCIYIFVRCSINPSLGPLPPSERKISWREKALSLRGIVLPLLLIIAVLGGIFFGLATPTEAAAVGAFGSLVCAAINRKLDWQRLRETFKDSLVVTSMIMWIILAAGYFATVYQGLGAPELIFHLLEVANLSNWGILILMQLTLLVLGCLLDGISILVLVGPIFIPLANSLGFDPLWFGILYVINMEMGFLTPPFGVNLFYLKGVAPKGITMKDIYLSVFPFVMLQATGLIIAMLFPKMILWLPNLVFKV